MLPHLVSHRARRREKTTPNDQCGTDFSPVSVRVSEGPEMAGLSLTERRSNGMTVEDAHVQPTAAEPDEETLPDAEATPDTPEAPNELALARELVLRAHPEVVHELISGSSLAELLASVPAAEAAFARVAATTRAASTREATSTPVPGGGAVRSASVNVEGLGPLAKIRAGLSQS
jgi:hypothetical protein